MSKKKRYFTLLLLSASLFGPSPTVVFAQHQVVIEAKSETLTSVLKRLERLSGYKMMYANDDVAGVKVSTSVKTTDVSKALDKILKGTGLTYTIDKQFVTIKKVPFVAASAPKGEAFIMQGHVYDESGLDVPGVTVMIVGTDKGTATDVDGRFSLKYGIVEPSEAKITVKPRLSPRFIAKSHGNRYLCGSKQVSRSTTGILFQFKVWTLLACGVKIGRSMPYDRIHISKSRRLAY